MQYTQLSRAFVFSLSILATVACTTKGSRSGAALTGNSTNSTGTNGYAYATPTPTPTPVAMNNNTGQTGGIFNYGNNGQTIVNGGGQEQVYGSGSNGSSTTVPTIVALSAWRCELMGDSVGQGDPDHDGLPDWKERQLWAKKCFNGSVPPLRDFMPWLLLGDNALRADGTPLALYPTFGSINSAGQAISIPAPIDSNASCDPAKWSQYVLIAFCTPGCYAPDQKIQASVGFEVPLASYRDSQPIEISKAREEKVSHIVTLSPGSSMDRLQFHSSPTEYVRDMDAATPKPQPYVTLTMASGKSIRITPEHPMVDGNGIMRAAKALELGDSLFTAEGSADKIVKIVNEDLALPAHNVSIKSADPMQSLVVAEGYLSGDLKYQRQEFQWLNRSLDRRNVPSEVVQGD